MIINYIFSLLRLMNKRYFILALMILSITPYEYTYAHGDNPDTDKHESELKAETEKKDRENWDDFMKAIKKQEKEGTGTGKN